MNVEKFFFALPILVSIVGALKLCKAYIAKKDTKVLITSFGSSIQVTISAKDIRAFDAALEQARIQAKADGYPYSYASGIRGEGNCYSHITFEKEPRTGYAIVMNTTKGTDNYLHTTMVENTANQFSGSSANSSYTNIAMDRDNDVYKYDN
jgi:hypothetical protein